MCEGRSAITPSSSNRDVLQHGVDGRVASWNPKWTGHEKKMVVLKNQLRCNVGILIFFTTIVNTHVYFWLSGIAGYDENLSAIYGYMSPVFTDFPASNV